MKQLRRSHLNKNTSQSSPVHSPSSNPVPSVLASRTGLWCNLLHLAQSARLLFRVSLMWRETMLTQSPSSLQRSEGSLNPLLPVLTFPYSFSLVGVSSHQTTSHKVHFLLRWKWTVHLSSVCFRIHCLVGFWERDIKQGIERSYRRH